MDEYGFELTGFDLEIGTPVPLSSEEGLETTMPDHYTIKVRYHATRLDLMQVSQITMILIT